MSQTVSAPKMVAGIRLLNGTINGLALISYCMSYTEKLLPIRKPRLESHNEFDDGNFHFKSFLRIK